MKNRVTKEECIDAIDFLHHHRFIEEMTRDQKWAVEILLKKVGNNYGIKI